MFNSASPLDSKNKKTKSAPGDENSRATGNQRPKLSLLEQLTNLDLESFSSSQFSQCAASPIGIDRPANQSLARLLKIRIGYGWTYATLSLRFGQSIPSGHGCVSLET